LASLEKFTSFENKEYIAQCEDVAFGYFESLVYEIKLLSEFVQTLPGFSKLDWADLLNLLKHNIFSIFAIKIYKLFINNEVFFFLPSGAHFSRNCICKCLGYDTWSMFANFFTILNDLSMTDNELSLTVVFVLSESGKLKPQNKQYRSDF
jgi:hypothetical protein